MDLSTVVRRCAECQAPIGWLEAKCHACGHEHTARQIRGAEQLLARVADDIALRYTPGTPQHAAYVEEMAEIDRFLATRHATVVDLPARPEPTPRPAARHAA